MRSTLVAGAALSVVVATSVFSSPRADAAPPPAPVVTAIIEGHDHDKTTEILTIFGSRLTLIRTFKLARNGNPGQEIGAVTVLLKTKSQVILQLPAGASTDPNPDFELDLGLKASTIQIPLTLTRGGPTFGTVGPASFSSAGLASLDSRFVTLTGATMTGALAVSGSDFVALSGTTNSAMGGVGVQGTAPLSNAGVGVSGTGATGVQGSSGSAVGGIGVLAQSSVGVPLQAEQLFQGTNIAVFKAFGVNQARIDATGKGFFNGGTQLFGADFAERVKVDRDAATFEAGDVIAIDPTGTRRFKLSDEAESSLVVGVYSTKPAMLAGLSDAMTDAWKKDEVPLGVVGIVPTKVCDEGGAIRPGDLLVAASVAGYAKKAPATPKIGAVIGKALAVHEKGRGKIEVFLTVR